MISKRAQLPHKNFKTAVTIHMAPCKGFERDDKGLEKNFKGLTQGTLRTYLPVRCLQSSGASHLRNGETLDACRPPGVKRCHRKEPSMAPWHCRRQQPSRVGVKGGRTPSCLGDAGSSGGHRHQLFEQDGYRCSIVRIERSILRLCATAS